MKQCRLIWKTFFFFFWHFQSEISSERHWKHFEFFQNRWIWIWRCSLALVVVRFTAVHKWNIRWVALKGYCITALENNVPTTLNLTRNLTDIVLTKKLEIKRICWCNYAILVCFYRHAHLSWLVFYTICTWALHIISGVDRVSCQASW